MSTTWLLVASMLVASASNGSASVILSYTGGAFDGTVGFYGQSFTTPSGSAYDNLSFNFFQNPMRPLATGTLYLFSSIYYGTPAELDTANALAHSISIAAGEYIFDPSVTVQPDTQYFVYADTLMSPRGGNPVRGGQVFAAQTSNDHYMGSIQSADFRLSGTEIPEPTSFTLVIPFLGGLVFFVRRQTLRR